MAKCKFQINNNYVKYMLLEYLKGGHWQDGLKGD